MSNLQNTIYEENKAEFLEEKKELEEKARRKGNAQSPLELSNSINDFLFTAFKRN